jgi:hypothetical protein
LALQKVELINFVKTNNPSLIRNEKIYLGKFDFTKEIKAAHNETKDFIQNCIEYAIVRDEFREFKKGGSS